MTSITIDGIEITNYDKFMNSYDITVPYDTKTLVIEGIKEFPDQTVDVIGVADNVFNFDNNNSTVDIMVTSEDLSSSNIYSINITRELTANLKNIDLNNDSIDFDFNPNTLRYDIVIPTNMYSLDIDVTKYFADSTVTIEGNNYIDDGNIIIITSTYEQLEKTYRIYIKKQYLITATDFNYTGGVQQYVVPETGIYNIELWGSAGGGTYDNPGGDGAYTSGEILLEKNQILYIQVGGMGKLAYSDLDSNSKGYNGGGASALSPEAQTMFFGGGGATDIRLVSGNWNDTTSLNSRIMVAAAGTGVSKYWTNYLTVPAGGLIGYPGLSEKRYTHNNGHTNSTGATQTSGGRGGISAWPGYYANGGVGTFGIGGTSTTRYGAGGSGGYYGGGGASYNNAIVGSGASGSSFISGHTGAVAITSQTNRAPLTGCVTGTFNNSCSLHYSDLYFEDTVMIDGAGYIWTNQKESYVNMPKPTGGEYSLGQGHEGNGYAKITQLLELSNNNYLDNILLNNGDVSIDFEPWIEEYTINLEPHQTELLIEVFTKDNKAVVTNTGMKEISQASQVYDLVVTAEDGTTRTYTLNVNRELSSVDKPNDIEILKMYGYLCQLDANHCDYNFDQNVTTYNIEVPSNLKDIIFEVTKENKYQEVILRKLVDGAYIELTDYNVIFDDVVNEYQIEVISEDKSLSTIYTYIFTVDPTSNNKLDDLFITNPNIPFEFNPDKSVYYLTIDSSYTSYDINYVKQVEGSTVEVKGNTDLKLGMNNAYVTVTAVNGAKRVYVLYVYKETDTNAYLSDLQIKDGDNVFDLSPSFNKTFNDYTTDLPSDITDYEIIATAESSLSTVLVKKPDAVSSLNRISITVTSIEGDVNIYYINATKTKNSNAKLQSLEITGYDFLFQPDIYEYDLTVNKNLTTLDITAIPQISTTKYKIVGNNLIAPENEIIIETTAEDGSTLHYQLNVLKEKSDSTTLNNILTDKGIVNEEITPGLLEYTMNVLESDEDINIEAIASDKDAVVTGNGTYALKTGENVIYIGVTSETGITTKYTLTVTRGLSTDTSIKEVEHNRFSEVVKVDENNYLINVQNEIEEIKLEVIPNNKNATVIGNDTYLLNTGENVIPITVKSASGTEEIHYVKVIRDLSHNDDLDFLLVHEGALSPSFKDTTIYYQVQVPNYVDTLTIDVITEDLNATYEILGDTTMVVGENEVIVRVTAEDGVTFKDYTLKVIKEESHLSDLTLKDLTISTGVLEPIFNSNTRLYYVTVENNISNISVEGILNDTSNRILGNGSYDLTVGKNVLVVTALDEFNNLLDYQIVVTRKPSADASLKNLVINSHALNQTFNKDILNYNLITSLETLEFTLIEPTEETATYEITNNENFQTGENIVNIIVTAPDKLTTKTYTITVTKEASNNNNLSSLDAGGLILTPEFHKSNTLYRLTVENNINSINIEGIAEDINATVDGNNIYMLSVGQNIVQLLVTSESGIDKSYAIVITRLGSSNNYLSNLYISEGEFDIGFDKEVFNYNVSVANDITSVFIAGEAEDNEATVTGFKKYELSEGLNVINIDVTSQTGVVRSYTLNVTREIINSAYLSELKITDYEFKSNFNKEIFEYTVEVDNEITSLDLSYVLEDPKGFSSVMGNEHFVEGLNEVLITVTSHDFSKEQIYKINVIRKMYTDNFLESLELSEGTLSPEFDPNNVSYEAYVKSDIADVTVMAETLDPSATVTGTGNYTMTENEILVDIIVTSDIGIERTYTIKLMKEYSDNNYLRDLEVKDFENNYEIAPKFDKKTNDYVLELSSDVERIILTGIAEDEKSLVSGIGTQVVLAGENTLDVSVTAENGNINVYSLITKKDYSTNNNPISITPSAGTLDQEFNKDIKEYTLTASDTELFLSFDVLLEDYKSSVAGNEQEAIEYGTSIRTIMITAEDESVNTYTFNIVKEASDVLLKELSIDGYDISFDSNTFTYDLSVSSSKSTLLESEITAIANDLNATVNLMGDISLPNSYTIEVIGTDNYTTQEYVVNITNDDITKSITSDVYEVSEYLIVDNIDVNEVVNNLHNKENIKIYKDDTLYSGLAGTGLIVNLEIDGHIYDSVKLVVLGDLNGDSKINIIDKILLINHTNRISNLTDAYYKASDINSDNYSDTTDLDLIDDKIIKSE